MKKKKEQKEIGSFLPNDIARCDNRLCEKNMNCRRYLDKLPFGTYWYNTFEAECDNYIPYLDV